MERLTQRKCSNCKISYPNEILSPLIGAGNKGGSVCGICALEMQNEALGINRKSFSGEMAEEFRQDAIAWRKKHKK